MKPAFRSEKAVFYADENAVYPVATVNYSNSDKVYNVSIKATDPYNNVAFTKNIPVTVPADGHYRIEELALPELDNKTGFWYLETTVSVEGSDPIVYNSGLSKVPVNDSSVPDGKYADFYGQHIATRVDMLPWKKINTSITRAWEDALVFLWNRIEPEKGEFHWDKADAYVKKALEQNMDVLAVLGYPSDWASARVPVAEVPAGGWSLDNPYKAERWVSKDIKFNNGVPGTGEDWSNYVYQSMKRYAGKVKYWEIVNEVNFHTGFYPATFSGTSEEYFLMLKLAREQADRVKSEYRAETGQDLELYVTTSGFSAVTPSADRQMAVDALNATNSQNYDIYMIHGYEGTKGIADILAAFKTAKETHPNLELWQGESYPLGSTNIPWRTYELVHNYMDFMSAGASKYINMGISSDDTFITRYSQSPTEVFQTVATLQNQIRKVNEYIGPYTNFTGESYLTVNHYMKRTDNKYLSVFSSDDMPLDLVVGNPGDIVSVTDNFGNSVPVVSGKIQKARSVFIVSNAPLQMTSASTEQDLVLVKNGDFERTAGDWASWPSSPTLPNWEKGWNRGSFGVNFYVSKNPAYAGDHALELNSVGFAAERTFMTQGVKVYEPGVYVLSAYIKKLEGGADVQPELNIWDGTRDHQLAPAALTDQYVKYSTEVEVTGQTQLTINVGILSGQGKLLFDNIVMEKKQAGEFKTSFAGPSGSVIGGTAFSAVLGLENVSQSVYGEVVAQSTRLTYDPNVLEFVSAESVRDGYNVVLQDQNTPGVVHIAATSVTGPITTDEQILRLNWKAKALSGSVTTVVYGTTVYADSLGQELSDGGVSFTVRVADKAALSTAIGEAQTVLQTAAEGTGIGQYPAGSKTVLQAAIDAALAVYNDPLATDGQVASAAASLNTAKNAFIASIITRLPEDINGDGRVSVGDLALAATHYGKSAASSPDWASAAICDINQDGVIDLLDLVAVAKVIE